MQLSYVIGGSDECKLTVIAGGRSRSIFAGRVPGEAYIALEVLL